MSGRVQYWANCGPRGPFRLVHKTKLSVTQRRPVESRDISMTGQKKKKYIDRGMKSFCSSESRQIYIYF